MMWTRLALALSMAANIMLGAALASYVDDYARLMTWACENGNGGHECGEE